MTLSIVIPTRNRPASLARCLASIAQQVQGIPRTEVLVVDDGSEEAAQAENRRLCLRHDFRWMPLHPTGGPARARNTGAGSCSGDWIAFLDDDVCVDNGWWDALAKAINEAPPTQVGIEGCTRAMADGVWDREVENLAGGLYLTSNIAYRKTALEQVGGFDESFEGPFCEDQELAVRMLGLGTIGFVPRLWVSHLPRSAPCLRFLTHAPARMRQMLTSEQLFWAKHPREYCRFRHAHDFRGTRRAILLRHALSCLRRRRLRQVLKHPFQFAVLVLASVVEQATAWSLTPEIGANR